MSMYGPPGEPYPGQPHDPGQPQDPWQAAPQDPYGQPLDPYSPQPWSGTPTSVSPGVPGQGVQGPGVQGPGVQGYPVASPQQQYGWSQPVQPPRGRGSGPIIAVIVVLAVLLCGGGVGVVYLISKDSGTNTADPDPSRSAVPSGSSAASSAAPSPSGSAGGSGKGVSPDVRAAKVKDCFVNEGTLQAPSLRKAACAPGTYEVVRRFDGTSDRQKCAGVPGYTHDYYLKVKDNDAASFVLCMKQL